MRIITGHAVTRPKKIKFNPIRNIMKMMETTSTGAR
jgi:hypothetical protein